MDDLGPPFQETPTQQLQNASATLHGVNQPSANPCRSSILLDKATARSQILFKSSSCCARNTERLPRRATHSLLCHVPLLTHEAEVSKNTKHPQSRFLFWNQTSTSTGGCLLVPNCSTRIHITLMTRHDPTFCWSTLTGMWGKSMVYQTLGISIVYHTLTNQIWPGKNKWPWIVGLWWTFIPMENQFDPSPNITYIEWTPELPLINRRRFYIVVHV